MTVIHSHAQGRRAFSKGGPEILAELATSTPFELLETAEAWADEGLRVLAVAARELDEAEDPLTDDVEHHLELLGVIALHDPLRASAAPAVEAARAAGIDVRMLTGDHPATARTIGHALGLADEAILARATPADKLELVRSFRTGAKWWRSPATASTTHRRYAGPMSASRWGERGPRPRVKRLRSSSPTTTSPRSWPQSRKAAGSGTTSASSSRSCCRPISARCSSSPSRSAPGSACRWR